MATGIREPAESTYTFASQPRAVVPQRRKYRDTYEQDGSGMQPCNIMYDPRVIRGNTYRQQTLTSASQDPVEAQRQQETRRKRQARARAQARMQKKDVEPVAGRQHIEVQTELYLEELTDRVEEADIGVQTDPFMDRAPDPLFIPAKTGVDAETQIENGDLFDFDLESKPILEVLVGKTLEQAMMEVMEEEELDRLRDHQLQFEELRNAELIETQRLEEQARRRREEKDRRLKQQAEVAREEREAANKIAARSFAQSYLSGLVPSVFRNLENGGYFYDAQEREIEASFLPWLMDGVETRLSTLTRAHDLLDRILLDVVHARLGITEEEDKAPEADADEAEAADVNNADGAEAGAAVENDDKGGDGDGKDDKQGDDDGDGGGEDAKDGAADDTTPVDSGGNADAEGGGPAEDNSAGDAPTDAEATSSPPDESSESAVDASDDAPAEAEADEAAADGGEASEPSAEAPEGGEAAAPAEAEPAADADGAADDGAPAADAE